MQPHIEAWARFCHTQKYSARMTIEQAIARNRAVLSVATWGPKCEVCGGVLQVGYKVLLPTEVPRSYTVGYIHIAPEWCARATEARRVKDESVRLFAEMRAAVYDAFDSVDREQANGAVFENTLLAVSSRIALKWLDLEPLPEVSE